MSNSDDKCTSLLLEQIFDEIKAVHELVTNQRTRTELNQLREGMKIMKDDVRTIEAAVPDQSHEINDHEQRMTRLEVRTV